MILKNCVFLLHNVNAILKNAILKINYVFFIFLTYPVWRILSSVDQPKSTFFELFKSSKITNFVYCYHRYCFNYPNSYYHQKYKKIFFVKTYNNGKL